MKKGNRKMKHFLTTALATAAISTDPNRERQTDIEKENRITNILPLNSKPHRLRQRDREKD